MRSDDVSAESMANCGCHVHAQAEEANPTRVLWTLPMEVSGGIVLNETGSNADLGRFVAKEC